jgi:hypothetical protein
MFLTYEHLDLARYRTGVVAILWIMALLTMHLRIFERHMDLRKTHG